MSKDITEIRAAIDVVIEYATRHENPPLRRALESIARNIDAETAQARADAALATAFRARLHVVGMDRPLSSLSDVNIAGFIRCAVRDTGARIVTGDEQPEDVAQLRAERDRYRAWIQDVARLGTHYDPNPTTTGSPEKRIGLLADYIRCMDTAMRETARRVLEDEGTVTGAEQSLPLGELIGFGNAERPNPESTAWISQPYHFPTEEAARNALDLGERATAVFLLPEARVR